MKIAHVVNSMEVGGAEVVVASLCRIHQRQGHRVEVHCLVRKGRLGEQLETDGIPVRVHGPGGRFPVMGRLYRTFRQDPPDVGHCHNVPPVVWGAPMLRAAGVSTVLATRHSLVAPPYAWRTEMQFSLASRLCDHVAGVCEATSRNLAAAPGADPSRILTIYNGAAEPAMGSEAIAKPAGVTFIMVSRLFHPKDHTTLLRAFAELRRTRSDATLWIVGDGELRSALEETARGLGIDGAVRFWGDCRNPGAFLHAADVFVLSSRSEGLPISLLEAMAAGLPAVVTDVGGMAEVIRHSDTGSRVPPADAGALAAALESWAADAERRRETGRRARQYFETHFTLEIMADLYLRLYRREPLPVSPFAAARSPQARPADAGS